MIDFKTFISSETLLNQCQNAYILKHFKKTLTFYVPFFRIKKNSKCLITKFLDLTDVPMTAFH